MLADEVSWHEIVVDVPGHLPLLVLAPGAPGKRTDQDHGNRAKGDLGVEPLLLLLLELLLPGFAP